MINMPKPSSAKLAYTVWSLREQLKNTNTNGTLWNDALRYLEQYDKLKNENEELRESLREARKQVENLKIFGCEDIGEVSLLGEVLDKALKQTEVENDQN